VPALRILDACPLEPLAQVREKLERLLPTSGFARDSLTLMMGTAFGQAIAIAISPILSRLYAPQDLGILALYMAITGVLSVAVTGRYDLAILLPAQDADAANVFGLSAIISVTFSLAVLVVVWAFNTPIVRLLDEPGIAFWLYFIPLSLLSAGIYRGLNCWSNRLKQYRRIAISRVLQAAILASASITIGLVRPGPDGLVIGVILGDLLAALALLVQTWRDGALTWSMLSREQMVALGRRYRAFPVFSVPADTVNAMARQIPVFLMTVFYGPAVVGFFALTQRVLGAPLSVVAAAVADVFSQRASREVVAVGHCRGAYLKTLKALAVLAIMPFTALVLVAPWLVVWVFGAHWETSGRYIQVMAPLYCLAFVVSPLSRTFYVTEHQWYDLIWQVALIIFSAASITAGYLLGQPIHSIAIYTAAYSVLYVLSLALSYRCAAPRAASA